MRKQALLFVLVVLALSVGSSLAEEIVYFTNGTSMPIRAHEFEEGMVKVDLGGDAFMAFPRDQVDRIEKADGDVALLPSSQANQIIEPHPGDNTRVYGSAPPDRSKRASRRAQQSGSNEAAPRVSNSGAAAYQPFARATQAQRRAGQGGGKSSDPRSRSQHAVNALGDSETIPPADGKQKKDLRGITKKDD